MSATGEGKEGGGGEEEERSMAAMLEAMERRQQQQKQKTANGEGENVLSEQELENVRKGLKDPEFRRILREYMDSMNDPDTRRENEAYIAQLESENRVPQGKQVLHPDPWMVVKTRQTPKDGDEAQKMFVNVVTAREIAPPSSQPAEGGIQWALPHSVGPLRMEKDSKGEECPTFDCCFHPEVKQRCMPVPPNSVRTRQQDRFLRLIVQTSLDTVANAYKQHGRTEITLDPNYHILRNISYKDGEVVSMLVAAESNSSNSAAAASSSSSSSSSASSSAAAASSSSSETAATQQQQKKPRRTHVRDTPTDSPAAQRDDDPSKPAYEIVERGSFSMTDHMLGTAGTDSNTPPAPRRPESLQVKIALTKLSSSRGVNLDVSDQQIHLVYPDVYDIVIALPYPVRDQEAKAKFVSASKTLVISLPVAAPPQPAPQRFHEPQTEDKDSGTAEANGAGTDEAGSNQPRKRASPKAKDHNRWVDADATASLRGTRQPQQQRPRSGSADKHVHFPDETEPGTDQAPHPEDPIAKEFHDHERSDTHLPLFLPASEFHGPKPGYAFRSGAEGLGYYRDVGPHHTALARPEDDPASGDDNDNEEEAAEVEPAGAGVAQDRAQRSKKSGSRGEGTSGMESPGSGRKKARRNNEDATSSGGSQPHHRHHHVRFPDEPSVEDAAHPRAEGQTHGELERHQRSKTHLPLFIPAKKYDKDKVPPGYVFKTGVEGLGYYHDEHAGTSHIGQAALHKETVRSPPLDHRDAPDVLSLIVQVAGIVEDTCHVRFERTTVSASFAARDAEDDEALTHYTFQYALAGEVDIPKCVFDVSDCNMAVVLVKAREGAWDPPIRPIEARVETREEIASMQATSAARAADLPSPPRADTTQPVGAATSAPAAAAAPARATTASDAAAAASSSAAASSATPANKPFHNKLMFDLD